MSDPLEQAARDVIGAADQDDDADDGADWWRVPDVEFQRLAVALSSRDARLEAAEGLARAVRLYQEEMEAGGSSPSNMLRALAAYDAAGSPETGPRCAECRQPCDDDGYCDPCATRAVEASGGETACIVRALTGYDTVAEAEAAVMKMDRDPRLMGDPAENCTDCAGSGWKPIPGGASCPCPCTYRGAARDGGTT